MIPSFIHLTGHFQSFLEFVFNSYKKASERFQNLVLSIFICRNNFSSFFVYFISLLVTNPLYIALYVNWCGLAQILEYIICKFGI